MKKFITLLLVLTGMVLNVNADDTWTLRGSFNSWSSSANVFSAGKTTIALEANQAYTFKVVKNDGSKDTYYGNSWHMDWNNSTDWTFETSGGDCTLNTKSAGTYTFTIDTSGSNPKVSIAFPSVGTIYFYNNLGWAQPYFYILDSNTWNDGLGVSLTGYYNGVAMEQIGTSNIWKADYPISASYVLFMKDKQNNYGNIYSTEAVWRIDYSSSASLFVPNTVSNVTKNETDYYSDGSWFAYPTPNYARSVTSGNFGTLCLPYDATVTGATVFTITSKVMDGSTLTGINLTSTTDNKIEAGKAYIFKATSSTLTATPSNVYSVVAADANGLLGNLSSTGLDVPADDGKYIVKNNQICLVTSGGSGVTVGQYKAYITLTGIGKATARGLDFIGSDEETTGINEVSSQKAENAEYFNLAGQRVTQPTKGLYIVNGKKVIIK